MATMIETKGAEYVERWIANMIERFGTTEANILHQANKQGVERIGDLTGVQAKAVVADLGYWSLKDRQNYDAMQRRADAMVPSCDNCGDCPRCI